MTTVATISDLHGTLPVLPDIQVDVLVLAGDICPDYAPRTPQGVYQQSRWLNTEFRRWLEPIAEQGVEIVATWGNHDYLGEAREYQPLFADLPWNLLVDEDVRLECGLHVWGTPWTPRLPYWAFYGTNNTLRLRAEAIPNGVDLLISHGPPFRYGDLVPAPPRDSLRARKYRQEGDEHVGDKTLNKAILRAQPKLTVCGHIHEARGSYMLNSHPVVNVSAVDERYNLYEKPWTVFEYTGQGFSRSTDYGAGRIRTDISDL